MHALLEYARLAGQRVPVRFPDHPADWLRWVGIAVLAWLALKLLGLLFRGSRG